MSIQVFDSTVVTQIIYLDVPPDQLLDQTQTRAGSQWSKALDLITAYKGLLRLYWGRRLEEPEKVQLHLGCTIPPGVDREASTSIYNFIGANLKW